MKKANVEEEYEKNKDLKKRDVEQLQMWIEKQPHLPKITELQLILFLQSCYFSIEKTKTTIDNFFTVKAHCPEVFTNRSPDAVREIIKLAIVAPLPKLTPSGDKVIFFKFMDCDVHKFVLAEQIKNTDMSLMLWLAQEGTSNGHIMLADMEGVTMGHLLRAKIHLVRQFIFYLQEAVPLRLKGFHFINVVPFIDTFLGMIKPFMQKQFFDMVMLEIFINAHLRSTYILIQLKIFINMFPKNVFQVIMEGTLILWQTYTDKLWIIFLPIRNILRKKNCRKSTNQKGWESLVKKIYLGSRDLLNN